MRLDEKEKIIDNYVKAIAEYLHLGLCESAVSGSYGEDIMEHFDIMANNFREIVRIEDTLGIDLITLFKALNEGFWFIHPLNGIKLFSMIVCSNVSFGDKGISAYTIEIDLLLFYKDYGKTWALTKEELEK